MIEMDWPRIYRTEGDKWLFTFVENGRAREAVISKRNAAILAKSIADSFEREYREPELVAWHHKVAV